MKRWIASVVTLMGALGLVMFGDDLVGVMLVINAQAGETLADITDVRWSIMSAMALLIGLILSSLAPAKPTNSPVGKRLFVLSGVLLFCGALPLAWGMLSAIEGFQALATSSMAPTEKLVLKVFSDSVRNKNINPSLASMPIIPKSSHQKAISL